MPVNNWAAIVRLQRRCMLEQSPKDLKEVADVRIFKRRLVNMLLA